MQRKVTLINRRGLHARAAAKIVTLSERFAAKIDVAYEDQLVSAASIMGLMLMGAGCGTELVLHAEGPDAADALESLFGLIASGFNEGE